MFHNYKIIKLIKLISAPSTLTAPVCAFEHTNINAAVNPAVVGLNEEALRG